jgi:hypothetical protein
MRAGRNLPGLQGLSLFGQFLKLGDELARIHTLLFADAGPNSNRKLFITITTVPGWRNNARFHGQAWKHFPAVKSCPSCHVARRDGKGFTM